MRNRKILPVTIYLIVSLLIIAFVVQKSMAQQAGRPRQVPTKVSVPLPCNPRDFIQAKDTSIRSICNEDGTWRDVAMAAGGVVPTPSPAGSDTQVQFNDGGSAFGGDPGLTYNKTADTLIVARNVVGGNIAPGFVTQATAAGTTTLTVASKGIQAFTGSTTQTVVLPVVSTLPQTGFQFVVLNDSSGVVTVNSSGGSGVKVMPAGTRAVFTCILLTGTDAASWGVTYVVDASNATNISSGSLANARLTNSTASASSYTNANITINTKGIVTAAANGSAGISNSAPSGTIPKSVDGSGNLGASQITDDGTDVQVGITAAGKLRVLGSALAPATSGNGQNAVESFRVTGAFGQSITGASSDDDTTAGSGAAVFIVSGEGGANSSVGSGATGGNGGGVNIQAANGGDGTANGGPGGTVSIVAGSGGGGGGSGPNGVITLTSADKININAATGTNIQGTNTNDSAASGFVGELLTASRASGDATSLTTATAKTITSVSLTAGDWDVWGIVDYVPAATTTTAVISQGASQTDNTLGAADTFTALSGGNLSGTILSSLLAAPAPMQRISLASTTTVFLIGKANFAISTMTAYGSIFARRIR